MSSPLPPRCSERTHINTPGSQQHLTNLANYLRGRFYMAFLIAGKVGVAVDLMKGYGHRVVSASIYIHYLAVPRVPRRKHLLVSRKSPLTPPTPPLRPLTNLLSSLHHCAFSASATPLTPPNWKKKKKKKKSPSRAGVFRQTASRESRAQRRGN